MKKLLVVLLAMTFVVGLAAQSAVAEDRLELSGQARVRAWMAKNFDFDDDDDNDDNQYWDQRFRVQAVINAADGVKGVLRMDFAEDRWGSNNWQGSRYGAGVGFDFGDVSSSEAGELQVDRAYIDVTKGMVNVKAGLQFMGLGNAYAYDNNQTGIQLTINTPLVIRLGYAKIDEDQTPGTALIGPGADGLFGTADDEVLTEIPDSTNLTDEDGFEDIDHYFIDLGYKTDAFSINVFYAMQTDGANPTAFDVTGDGVADFANAEDEPTLLGAMGKFAVGPVNILAELNIFGGERTSVDLAGTETTVDYKGLQFIADASMNLSDALTVGVQGIYSDGNDDATEEKLVRMPNAFFGSLYYANYGAFFPDEPNAFGSGDVFDPLGTQSGAFGGGVYATFKPMDVLTLAGNFMFLSGVEDEFEGQFDDGFVFNVSAEYMLAQNCTLALGYTFADVDLVDADGDGSPETDDAQAIIARLQITF